MHASLLGIRTGVLKRIQLLASPAANGSVYDCTKPLRRGGRTARDFVLGEDGLNVLVGCHAGGPTTLAIATSSFGRWSKTRL